MRTSPLAKYKVLALSLAMTFVGCSDEDENKVEEPVQPATTEQTPAPEPTPAPAAVTFSPETVYFGYDDYTLSSEAQQKLQALGQHLTSSANSVVQINGHCDERGSVEYNLALGERRANSVKNFLSTLGVAAGRLSTTSYGEESPAVEGHDEAAWSKNRRVEFNLTTP